MEQVLGFFTIVFGIGVFTYFLYVVYYTLDLYFLNPFHKIPPLTESEKHLIRVNLPFYKTLKPRLKKRFERRVVRFRDRKQIDFHKDVKEQEQIQLLLSATACMLTLGMADFIIESIKKIVVYPEEYYSKITKHNHYGEYNPALKTLFFSAKQLQQGFDISTDNINLAVHEFGHALSFNVANKLNIRSYLFLLGMERLEKMLLDKDFLAKWEKHNYFRSYGKTNIHEFFSVVLESFIETPKQFEKHYPKLLKTLRFMMNMGFYKLP